MLPTAAEAPSIDATGNRISFVAFGAIEAPATPFFEAFVRDRGAAATTLVSRAHGAAGASADAAVVASSISASGDCVAFTGRFTNLNDGFASADFAGVLVLLVGCPFAGFVRLALVGDFGALFAGALRLDFGDQVAGLLHVGSAAERHSLVEHDERRVRVSSHDAVVAVLLDCVV